MKNWFLTASALLRNFHPHSSLVLEQWSLAPDGNFEEPPCHKSNAQLVEFSVSRRPRTAGFYPEAYDAGCVALQLIAREGSLFPEYGQWEQPAPGRPLSSAMEMVMSRASPKQREALFRDLAKRMKITERSLHRALACGPMDLVPLILEKHPQVPERALQKFFTRDPYMFNGPIKFHPDNTYNVQAILRAVDLLHRPSEQISDEVSHMIFENSARIGSPELMQKIVALGMKPNNTETLWNSLACAIIGRVRLFFSASSESPINRASIDNITLMLRFGAKPSQEAFANIEKYSDDPAVREQLALTLSQGLTR